MEEGSSLREQAHLTELNQGEAFLGKAHLVDEQGASGDVAREPMLAEAGEANAAEKAKSLSTDLRGPWTNVRSDGAEGQAGGGNPGEVVQFQHRGHIPQAKVLPVPNIPPPMALQYHRLHSILRTFRHAAKCPAGMSDKVCKVPLCVRFVRLIEHSRACRQPQGCSADLCKTTKQWIRHFSSCKSPLCCVCIPVRHGDCSNGKGSCPVCPKVTQAIRFARQEAKEKELEGQRQAQQALLQQRRLQQEQQRIAALSLANAASAGAGIAALEGTVAGTETASLIAGVADGNLDAKQGSDSSDLTMVDVAPSPERTPSSRSQDPPAPPDMMSLDDAVLANALSDVERKVPRRGGVSPLPNGSFPLEAVAEDRKVFFNGETSIQRCAEEERGLKRSAGGIMSGPGGSSSLAANTKKMKVKAEGKAEGLNQHGGAQVTFDPMTGRHIDSNDMGAGYHGNDSGAAPSNHVMTGALQAANGGPAVDRKLKGLARPGLACNQSGAANSGAQIPSMKQERMSAQTGGLSTNLSSQQAQDNTHPGSSLYSGNGHQPSSLSGVNPGPVRPQIPNRSHSAALSSSSAFVPRSSSDQKPPPGGAPPSPLRSTSDTGGVVTSLTELFTPAMIRHHIKSLRHMATQNRSTAPFPSSKKAPSVACGSASAPPSPSPSEGGDQCNLCGVEKLYLEPPPLYCTQCNLRIQKKQHYAIKGSGENKQFFCKACCKQVKKEVQAQLEQKENNEEPEESWVECDTCKKWMHQVCALFNQRCNEGSKSYTCPRCCLAAMEKGTRQPAPLSSVLGASDLPKTHLSDELEERLRKRLAIDRSERARAQGLKPEQVPTAEDLVVRVVASTEKKMQTKPLFQKIFLPGDYPTEFPYKSKVVLLFQRMDGVEVCLFGMYVQEYGADADQPNTRRTYLSYLDSVKYFRPEVKTLNNEALRTVVYHEILIGYLDLCKRRGFSSCYIWACPPQKGEDYILYCHPETQKTPQPAKLREWYLTMLRKAKAEGIVVEVCNIYENSFITCGESRATVRAKAIPYFDGDYWPGAIEEALSTIQSEEEEAKKGKKGKRPKPGMKRGVTGKAEEATVGTAVEDQLMSKLGDTILSIKEDFLMVHLHACCSHCRNFLVEAGRYTCRQCPNFHLCHKCYAAEKAREPRERHPSLSKDVHDLFFEHTPAVPFIEDKDETMESEFFDTRQAFLSLCQGNHYQYDTLRRAKHSSMMLLYHLHNPNAPAFVSTCNVCQTDIEIGQGFRCEQCDYDVCAVCKEQKANGHPHPLVAQAAATTSAQSAEGRRARVGQMQSIFRLLRHASRCTSRPPVRCTYPGCVFLHRLFHHGSTCTVRVRGGCRYCQRMWSLLRLHAKSCTDSACLVPRCKDLKAHEMIATQQMETRRRASYQAMNQEARERATKERGNSSE
eukprot:TRINITY_DN264_c1_g1_i6.p1 TRINITY_DN264_c1_g1~~TRINITY_DN264_c1_g1_i6.p1  ORF type:complete len:1617 (-),score=375.18 TRINITY_DN264_c1_g1_i6:703-4923(-)